MSLSRRSADAGDIATGLCSTCPRRDVRRRFLTGWVRSLLANGQLLPTDLHCVDEGRDAGHGVVGEYVGVQVRMKALHGHGVCQASLRKCVGEVGCQFPERGLCLADQVVGERLVYPRRRCLRPAVVVMQDYVRDVVGRPSLSAVRATVANP